MGQLKSMIESCYTYGNAERGSHLFETYIKQYKDTVEDFDRVYDEHLQYLKDNYTIEHNVYTDSEGCTYNSLNKK